jgi:hypothetical protein
MKAIPLVKFLRQYAKENNLPFRMDVEVITRLFIYYVNHLK